MWDITKYKEKEAKALPIYGRKQILLLADAYKQLATSFSKEQPDIEHCMDRREYIYRKQMADTGSEMAERIREMADRMSNLAGENVTYRLPGKKEFRTLSGKLKKHGILLKEIFLSQGKTLRFCLTMKSLRSADYTTEDVAQVLSNQFGVPLISSKDNLFFVAYEYDCYTFEVLPKFTLTTGIARAIKEKETVSGDNYSFYEVNASTQALILSDGAGSGTEAGRDSELVLELAEKYYDTGFEATAVADMINGLFLAKAREQNMPTLDMCTIDLQEGKVSFIKYGSADSYIYRKDEIFKIRNVGFPLGFCKAEENSVSSEAILQDGDFIIMITDGIIDGAESEDQLLNIIAGMNACNPGEIANGILAAVVRRCGGRIRDDMTVLVAAIWE